jgi:hypothetical protein
VRKGNYFDIAYSIKKAGLVSASQYKTFIVWQVKAKIYTQAPE